MMAPSPLRRLRNLRSTRAAAAPVGVLLVPLLGAVGAVSIALLWLGGQRDMLQGATEAALKAPDRDIAVYDARWPHDADADPDDPGKVRRARREATARALVERNLAQPD